MVTNKKRGRKPTVERTPRVDRIKRLTVLFPESSAPVTAVYHRAEGLIRFRPKNSRRVVDVKLTDIYETATGQLPLPLP